MKMLLKIVFALVSAAALCCAQTDAPSAPSSSGIPAKEVPVPPIPTPASPPETNQPPTGQSPAGQSAAGQNANAPESQPAPSVQVAPASQAAPASQSPSVQPPPSGKAAAEGRYAGARPDSGHKAYVIGPLDVLMIKVWNNQNLSGAVDVGPDGLLSMPLIGEIRADGLTARQLEGAISERLRDFFNNNPDVNVEVVRNNSKRYFVYGGVLRGGEFPLNRDTTIMDALSAIGGFKDFANKKKIYVQRGTQRFNFNYNDVSKGKHLEENILIENGDRIFVPE
jgi:polysaccharide export outer membrane protein